MLIIYFQYLLSDRGAATSVLDEHVRPRISKIAKEILNDNKIIEKLPQNVKKVIERVKAKKNGV